MKKLLLSTAAVAVLAVAASANAVEPGRFYVRGDAGYGINKLSITNGKTQKPKGFIGDIGVGYNLSDQIRTDLTFNYAKLKKKIKGNNSGTVKPKYMSLMANVYYDINNSSDFTPYVMAGLGFARNEISSKQQGGASIKSKKNNTFAYQLGAGVTYKLSSELHLDLGYKFGGFGSSKYKAKKKDGGGKFGVKSKNINSFTAGVIYSF